MPFELSEAQAAHVDRYRALLWEWNEKMNLTRHTDFDTFVSRDVVDSLQLAQLLAAGRRSAGRGQRRRRAGRPAGHPATRSGRDSLRIDAEEGQGA